jgi:hypothetical protein
MGDKVLKALYQKEDINENIVRKRFLRYTERQSDNIDQKME